MITKEACPIAQWCAHNPKHACLQNPSETFAAMWPNSMQPNIKAKSFSKLLKEVRAETVFTSVWAHNMAGEWASGRRRQFMFVSCIEFPIVASSPSDLLLDSWILIASPKFPLPSPFPPALKRSLLPAWLRKLKQSVLPEGMASAEHFNKQALGRGLVFLTSQRK